MRTCYVVNVLQRVSFSCLDLSGFFLIPMTVLKFLPFSCVNVGAFVYKLTLSLKSEAYTKYFPFLLFYRVRGWIRLAPSTEVCDVFHKNDKLVKMT